MKEHLLGTPCPRCGAGMGERCRSEFGEGARISPHRARRSAAGLPQLSHPATHDFLLKDEPGNDRCDPFAGVYLPTPDQVMALLRRDDPDEDGAPRVVRDEVVR